MFELIHGAFGKISRKYLLNPAAKRNKYGILFTFQIFRFDYVVER